MSGTRWLSADEQALWRNWLKVTSLLEQRLATELDESGHGLTLAEYALLVSLSESPGRALRMSELAASLVHSRSRLTHAITRLESRGLVVRQACPQDGRGVFAVLTDAGSAALEAAAPVHVEGVRAHLFDPLGDRAEQLGEILAVLAEHLGPSPCDGADRLDA